jgi:hypothetical protein
MMKIKGQLTEMLVKIEPEVYGNYLIELDNEKVIYVQVLKALYGKFYQHHYSFINLYLANRSV